PTIARRIFRGNCRGNRGMSALILARFTIQEAVSRKLVLAAALLSLLFIALYAFAFSLMYAKTVEQPDRTGTAVIFAGGFLTTFGLYAIYFLSSFLALFLTVGAVSGEIDSGMLHAVLARPIRRAELILDRWLGYAGLVASYVVIMGSAVLLT